MDYFERLQIRIRRSRSFLRNNKRVRRVLLLGIAALLALPTTWMLQYFLSLQVENPKVTYKYPISNEIIYGSPIEIVTNGPSYFESVGRIYAYMTSRYADAFVIFNVWLSLDNSSWTRVHLLTSEIDNRSEMADLGLVQLDKPTIKMYVKYYIPPQTFAYPINATKAEIEASFKGFIQIARQPTSNDTALSIFTFFIFFALILQIFDFVLLKEDRKRTQSKNAKTFRRKREVG